MITSGFAPVPAFDGGAVECLSTVLLDKNEKKARYQFIVCTIFDKRIDESEYKLTKFIQIYVGRKRYWKKFLIRFADYLIGQRTFLYIIISLSDIY